jgi:hypothetical protein
MSKEYLEALDRLYRCNDDDYALGYQLHDYNLLKQALIKLEQIEKGKNTDIIDNYMTFKNSEQVEPSKAMECLERVSELQYIDHYESREKEIEIIEQALIKAQEQEKENARLKEILMNGFKDRDGVFHKETYLAFVDGEWCICDLNTDEWFPVEEVINGE